MLQNRSSSAEFAHAIAEASVSGHRLDSGGKSLEGDARNNFFNPEFFCPKEEERELRII